MNYATAFLLYCLAEAAWNAESWPSRDPQAYRDLTYAADLVAGLEPSLMTWQDWEA